MIGGSLAFLGGAYTIEKTKGKWYSDKRKLRIIFNNIGAEIRQGNTVKRPKLYRETPIRDGVEYVYKLPLGMSSKILQKLDHVLVDGLNKPVLMDFDGMLRIRVFEQELPNMLEYGIVPENISGWNVMLGKALGEDVFHNFDDRPHMIVGGATRYGKTVLLKLMTASLLKSQPDNVTFDFIDLKGGLEFTRFTDIPQANSVSANAFEAYEALAKVHQDLAKRMAEFRKKGIGNVVDSPIKERRFIIVDEAAELMPDKSMPKEQKSMLQECQLLLSEIARIGGALGYRLIFCTQYPTSDVLPRQIKQNADVRVCFKLSSQYASGVVLDEAGAEELPKIPGRAIFKIVEKLEMQVPYLSDRELDTILDEYRVVKDDEQEANDDEEGTTTEDIIDFE